MRGVPPLSASTATGHNGHMRLPHWINIVNPRRREPKPGEKQKAGNYPTFMRLETRYMRVRRSVPKYIVRACISVCLAWSLLGRLRPGKAGGHNYGHIGMYQA